MIQKVKFRKKALPKIMAYIRKLEFNDIIYNDKAQAIKEISSLFNHTAEILNKCNARDDLDGAKWSFRAC